MKVFFMTTSNGCKAASTLRRPVSDIGHFGYFSRRNYYYSSKQSPYRSRHNRNSPTPMRAVRRRCGLRG